MNIWIMRSYIYYLIAVLSVSACGGGGGGSSASSSSPLVTFSQVGANSAVVIGGGISNEVDYTYNLATNKLTSVSNHQRGQTGASVADALSRFMTGKDKFSTAIVDNVKELMTIYDIPAIKDGSATGETFAELMSGIGRGLNAFAGGQLGSALKGVGASILNFLKGGDSPIEEMVALADNAKELDTASDAIEKLATSLSVISAMKFDGSNLNFKAFAKDLKESVPIIEANTITKSIPKVTSRVRICFIAKIK